MKTLLFAAALICGCYLTYLIIQETPESTESVQSQELELIEDQRDDVASEPVSLVAESNAISAQVSPNPRVTLQAVSGKTIPFKTQTGQYSNDTSPQEKNIPHLVLYRNAQLTASQERTINIILSGIEIPAKGILVRLSVETQHGDPDQGGDEDLRIIVWQEERRVENSESGVVVVFTTEFGGMTASVNGPIPTPSDYFRYTLTVTDSEDTPLYTFIEDYAYLMESQWVAPLP